MEARHKIDPCTPPDHWSIRALGLQVIRLLLPLYLRMEHLKRSTRPDQLKPSPAIARQPGNAPRWVHATDRPSVSYIYPEKAFEEVELGNRGSFFRERKIRGE
jgi:hypothetical protein